MRLLEVLKTWFKEEIYLPVARDSEANVPSTLLFFVYISFIMASGSIVLYHLDDKLLIQTSITVLFFVLCTVLYKLKNLTKAKIDLDDRSIDLESDNDKK